MVAITSNVTIVAHNGGLKLAIGFFLQFVSSRKFAPTLNQATYHGGASALARGWGDEGVCIMQDASILWRWHDVSVCFPRPCQLNTSRYSLVTKKLDKLA